MYLRASFSAWHTAFKKEVRETLEKTFNDPISLNKALINREIDPKEKFNENEVETVIVTREYEYEVTDSEQDGDEAGE